jgi:hypothetical protein
MLHESSQLKDFESLPSSHPSIPLLRDVVREFRDDELEHLDTAVEHHAQRAPAHALLTRLLVVDARELSSCVRDSAPHAGSKTETARECSIVHISAFASQHTLCGVRLGCF